MMHTIAWFIVACGLLVAAAKLVSHRLTRVKYRYLVAAVVIFAIIGTLVDAR
ncbi:hypothetical protein [Leuconostoc carnosum]